MMEDCKYMTHSDNNENEIETNMVTLDNQTEKFQDITPPAMMEDRGNKEHDDKKVNENDVNNNNMNESEGTCPYIKLPALMVECEDKNTLIHLIT